MKVRRVAAAVVAVMTIVVLGATTAAAAGPPQTVVLPEDCFDTGFGIACFDTTITTHTTTTPSGNVAVWVQFSGNTSFVGTVGHLAGCSMGSTSSARSHSLIQNDAVQVSASRLDQQAFEFNCSGQNVVCDVTLTTHIANGRAQYVERVFGGCTRTPV